ncbi:MAG: hypothetical protein ACK5MG_03430 [Bacteroidales bacterium]
MKKIYNSLIALFVAVLLLAQGACSDDPDGLVLSGNDANILTATASLNSASFKSTAFGDSVIIAVPSYVDRENVKVSVEISENATIDPIPEAIPNWGSPHRFTVTSYNGTTKDYVIAVVEDAATKNYNGDIRIGSQNALDDFFSSGYTEIEGNISIYQESAKKAIKDLSAMGTLKMIKGNLTIREINARHIDLENLEEVGSVLIVSPSVTEINMPKLRFVAERFQVGESGAGEVPTPHQELEIINLSSLEYIGGTLKYFWCTKLETLEHLSKLTYVGKDFIVYGGAYKNLKGIEGVKAVNGQLYLSGKLNSLEGFNIERVGTNMTLFLPYVTDLSPLASLKTIGNGMTLFNNTDLTDLKGLEHIHVPNLRIENFLSLESFEGLSIESAMKILVLQGFPKLHDISVLSGMQSAETVILNAMSPLTSLSGLENLQEVRDRITISGMPVLEDISALSNLRNVGTLEFITLETLADFSPLSHLTEIGSLRLDSLNAATDFDGFNNLTKITNGGLAIVACHKLDDLSPFSNISSVTFAQQSDKIWIERNDKLFDYTPVAGLIETYMRQRRVYIKDNGYNPTEQNIRDSVYVGEGGDGMGSIK